MYATIPPPAFADVPPSAATVVHASVEDDQQVDDRSVAAHRFPPSVVRLLASMGAVTLPPSMFGVPALRSEDPRFLRGEGRYVENIVIPDALRAVFVRSIIPHGRVTGMEGVDEARSMPGVAAVFTADDLQIRAAEVERERGGVDRHAG